MTPDAIVRHIRAAVAPWFIARLDPIDRQALLAEMPRGACWVAVVITNADAVPCELLVISDTRPPRGWRRWTETLTPASAGVQAALWLRCRRPHEWWASSTWETLVAPQHERLVPQDTRETA